MSSAAVVWVVTIPIVIGIGLFIWFVWENNRKLDSRIRSGDISLLSSSSYSHQMLRFIQYFCCCCTMPTSGRFMIFF